MAAYVRRGADDAVLIFSNLAPEAQSASVPAPYRRSCTNLLTSSTVSLGEKLELKPYSYLWLQLPAGD